MLFRSRAQDFRLAVSIEGVDVFLLFTGLNGEEAAFVGVGIAKEVVYAGLMEEGRDEVSGNGIEGERGDGRRAAQYGVQMGLERCCHCWLNVDGVDRDAFLVQFWNPMES